MFRLNSLFLIFLAISCASPILKLPEKLPVQGKFGGKYKYTLEKRVFYIRSEAQKSNLISLSMQSPFLLAESGQASVKYRMASFKIKNETNLVCENQDIDSVQEEGNGIVLKGKLSGKNCDATYAIRFTPKKDNELGFEIKLSNPELNRLTIKFVSTPEEGIFGMGEQFTHFNLKGKSPFLFTEEQGIGRGDQPITAGANLIAGAGGNEYTTYFPIPFWITSDNRGFFIENSGYIKVNLENPDFTSVTVWDFPEDKGAVVGTVFVGDSPKSILKSYTEKTGRYPELPSWAYGTWLGLQGGTKKVNAIIDQHLKEKNPVTALWIQDWCGRRITNFGDQLKWRWYADEKQYPDFKNFVKEQNKKGIQVLGYINSFLADKDPKKENDDFTNPLLEEAKAKGYLVKNKEGGDYLIQTVGFPAYLIDLTNPAAVKWTKDLIKKNMIDVGLSGWMADFGEWLPTDAVLHSGISAKNYHNIYPVDWARINREAIKEAKKEKEIVFFTRAGYSYSNAHSTLFWLGDQMVSFGENDGLPSTVVGLLSGGMSGIALNHSDIGGYTTINNPIRNYHRSKELLLRWAELNAFTTVYRTHEGNRPLKNWQAYTYTNENGDVSKGDEETVQIFSKLGRLHSELGFYIKDLVKEASETGIPVVRPLYLEYPTDKKTYSLKYQFLLGKDVLVLPVLESGEKSVKGYVPEGNWEYAWSDVMAPAKQYISMEAPIGKPAVFLRKDSPNYNRLKKVFQKLQ